MRLEGFAVIDLETTGLSTRRDRVVEIAIVHLDPDGRITGKWETLVHPQRDLGAQSIHGIRARDILRAPRFEEVAGEIVELERGTGLRLPPRPRLAGRTES